MPDSPVLEFDRISAEIAGKRCLHEVSLTLAPGEFHGLLGPNGAGKTTALRLLYHALRPSSGEVRLHGRPQSEWSRAEWSRSLGVLVQGGGLLAGLTVTDIVDIGLQPLGLDTREQTQRRGEALEIAGLTTIQTQSADTLSGGELQRCYFAQLLARDPDIYVLDEPTNHLDLHYQLVLLDEVKRRGKPVLATLHDLSMAARYCDSISIMQTGRVVAYGPTRDILTADQIAQTYQVEAHLAGNALEIVGAVDTSGASN